MFPSWWPSGWKIGSRLKRLPLPRTEILVIVAACVVAFVITLSVLASQSASRARRAAELSQVNRRAPAPPPITASDLGLGEEDFLLPSFEPPAQELRYVPLRPRQQRWTADQAAKYWVSPRRIATDLVQSENDRAIQRLFQDVP